MRTIYLHLGTATAAMLLATMAVAAEQAPTPAPAASSDPMQQMVCRKDLETGSLVRSKKTCHTRGQWAYIDDANQSTARRVVDDGTGRPSSN